MTAPPNPDLHKLRKLVALEIWRMEPAGEATAEERRAEFIENRKEYGAKAQRFIKRLEKSGVNLTLTDPEI